VKRHGKVLFLTEECSDHSYVESLAGRVSQHLFQFLDAPVMVMGAENVPAIPLNTLLEKTMLPSADKVKAKLDTLLGW
jgi:2-oxoisovalerate dehydrogenase E1 component